MIQSVQTQDFQPDLFAYFAWVTVFGNFVFFMASLLAIAVSASKWQTIKRMAMAAVIAALVCFGGGYLFLPRWAAFFVGRALIFFAFLSAAVTGWLHVRSLRKNPFDTSRTIP
jgi:hypothetical protein